MGKREVRVDNYFELTSQSQNRPRLQVWRVYATKGGQRKVELCASAVRYPRVDIVTKAGERVDDTVFLNFSLAELEELLARVKALANREFGDQGGM